MEELEDVAFGEHEVPDSIFSETKVNQDEATQNATYVMGSL